jgi:LmbE family N-acetylglucosaminyl deacetylase
MPMRHCYLCGAGVFLALACVVAGPTLGADGQVFAQAGRKPRTLLAIFAHPDDEQVVSPMLARYAREEVTVYLAIATDGRQGVREHAGIGAGDALAATRATEARCACEKLRIQAPILMGFEDGTLETDAIKPVVLEKVIRLLSDLKPDVIVTWGPDGVTGHTDHRMVSNLVTEVIQRGAAPMPARLYYVELSSERASILQQSDAPPGSGVPQTVALVDDRYLPVRIAYGEGDARAASEALACHKTQYTPEEMAIMTKMVRGLENGAVRLRPWFVESGSMADLFAK